MVAPIHHNQLTVINKTLEIDLISLFKNYNFVENHYKRKTYNAIFSNSKKLHVKRK